ncbi:hypothetical protein Nepgr_027176 [Nepenthes gracilis]|uniref:Uncharacterized protein n=1 Tax=Nepenthes gracilis TaxID=150966 RepID=A0AAD3Y186_NEPGR|nr:hypothetical protein Nepgr_027176 [Nepenthes gracilis]
MGFESNSPLRGQRLLAYASSVLDDVGVGDCNSPNGAKLDPQSPPGLPVPPIPDPTNPELLVLAPSISPVRHGAPLQWLNAYFMWCCAHTECAASSAPLV